MTNSPNCGHSDRRGFNVTYKDREDELASVIRIKDEVSKLRLDPVTRKRRNDARRTTTNLRIITFGD